MYQFTGLIMTKKSNRTTGTVAPQRPQLRMLLGRTDTSKGHWQNICINNNIQEFYPHTTASTSTTMLRDGIKEAIIIVVQVYQVPFE
jgi:hypothetical protein